MASDLDPAILRRQVEEIQWCHSIDLGYGVVTPGQSKTAPLTGAAWPDVRGRTVLDIGAWDGLNSFRAEREGAERVVALDHYVWGVDLHARHRYWEECRAQGVLPDQGRDLTDFWRPTLPGKAGFDLAREALQSGVEPVVADFLTMDLGALGTFDVVLFLGVLYHMADPLGALQRVRQVTAGVAVIETAAMAVEGLDDQPLSLFFADDALEGDFGNWFAFSERGLHELCRAAGFAHVETRIGPPARRPPADTRALGRLRYAAARRLRPSVIQYRPLVVHAYARDGH